MLHLLLAVFTGECGCKEVPCSTHSILKPHSPRVQRLAAVTVARQHAPLLGGCFGLFGAHFQQQRGVAQKVGKAKKEPVGIDEALTTVKSMAKCKFDETFVPPCHPLLVRSYSAHLTASISHLLSSPWFAWICQPVHQRATYLDHKAVHPAFWPTNQSPTPSFLIPRMLIFSIDSCCISITCRTIAAWTWLCGSGSIPASPIRL